MLILHFKITNLIISCIWNAFYEFRLTKIKTISKKGDYMRTIDTKQIKEQVTALLLESNYNIGEETFKSLRQNYELETNVISKK